MAEIFIWVPDADPSVETQIRVDEAKFGDGYTQTVARGVNPVEDTWTLTFSLRKKAEVLAIEAFLRARLGATFQWTNPAGEVDLFKCKKWSKRMSHDFNWSLTATFEQVYG